MSDDTDFDIEYEFGKDFDFYEHIAEKYGVDRNEVVNDFQERANDMNNIFDRYR